MIRQTNACASSCSPRTTSIPRAPRAISSRGRSPAIQPSRWIPRAVGPRCDLGLKLPWDQLDTTCEVVFAPGRGSHLVGSLAILDTQLYAIPDGQHQAALGQCWYVDHKKYFRNFNFNFNYRELLSKSATFSLRGFGVVSLGPDQKLEPNFKFEPVS